MEEQLIVLGLVNAVGLLSKIAYDARQVRKNGNPNGWKRAIEKVEDNIKPLASKEDVKNIAEQLTRFSDRVDVRDRNQADKCSSCHQRLASVETALKLLHSHDNP